MNQHEEDFADLFQTEWDRALAEMEHMAAVYRKYGKHELANELTVELWSTDLPPHKDSAA